MNNKRRTQLERALSILSNASSILEDVLDAEQDSMDNYPENLQSTDRFERMEQAVDSLGEALDLISGAKESVRSAL